MGERMGKQGRKRVVRAQRHDDGAIHSVMSTNPQQEKAGLAPRLRLTSLLPYGRPLQRQRLGLKPSTATTCGASCSTAPVLGGMPARTVI